MSSTYMNRSGTYVHVPGEGMVKVSDAMPHLALSVFVPKGDLPHYDPAAKRRFESKADKRAWMKEHHLREGGIITPDKRWDDHSRNPSKPSSAAMVAARQRQATIEAQGGVDSLLDRIRTGKGNFL